MSFFNPVVYLAFMVLVAVLTGAGYDHIEKRRIAGCDACRIDAGGGSMIAIAHTCSPARALYRDKDGVVYEFGKPAKTSGPFMRGRAVARVQVKPRREKGRVYEFAARDESDRTVTEMAKHHRRA